MAVTLKEVEAFPSSYPDVPADLSVDAAALSADALWQRIEAYTRVRWTARQVVWTVEGEGPWEAPLSPASLETVEVWEHGAWADVTPGASPLGGYDLPGDGPYRITAEVGGGDVPAVVSEAFRRLAEYLADEPDGAAPRTCIRAASCFRYKSVKRSRSPRAPRSSPSKRSLKRRLFQSMYQIDSATVSPTRTNLPF